MYQTQLTQLVQLINIAKEQEQRTGRLANALTSALPKLHATIKLPASNPEQALFNFITRYIDHVPDCFKSLVELSEEAGILDFSRIFLDLCLEYFLSPPDIVHEHSGLLALLDEAYLAHRLMEEINDQMILKTGIPFTPMDMSKANLIVHDLIGENFANKLDMAVYLSLETTMTNNQIWDNNNLKAYVENRKIHGWEKDIHNWPCLAEKLKIGLDFSSD